MITVAWRLEGRDAGLDRPCNDQVVVDPRPMGDEDRPAMDGMGTLDLSGANYFGA